DLRIKKSLLKCNWTIRKRLPRCKMRLKKRLLAFSRRLHARIRKTRYMHKMRCLLINRRSLLLALRLLWKTPIFPSNSRFPRLFAKCLLKLKRLVSILLIDSTVDIFTFYVPHRHVYGEQWIKFMKDGVNATPLPTVNTTGYRSEERRVGKECRCRWSQRPE